jgi:hypothetical protein
VRSRPCTIDEGVSGKALNNRPELAAALTDLDAGHGAVLMVGKLDRLSRGVHDATGLLLRAERAGWGLICARRRRGHHHPTGRGHDAGARRVRRARAPSHRGAHEGRAGRQARRASSWAARAQGGSWSAIARDLNADATPTAQGGTKWHPATVRYVHESRAVAVG